MLPETFLFMMFGRDKIYYSKSNLKIIPEVISGKAVVILLLSAPLLFAFLIGWLNNNPSLQNIWNDFTTDKNIPASFCEQLHFSNPVRQPVNTFSNIIYLITAIIILKDARGKKFINTGSYLPAGDIYSVLFCLILLYVFSASVFYHSSLINIAHTFDYSAVFSFTLFPIMFLAGRLWVVNRGGLLFTQKRKSKILFLAAFLIINFLLVFLIPKGKENSAAMLLVMLFLAMALATVLFERKKPGQNYLVVSIASVLIAGLWFELDKNKILCNPAGYFQFHSLWNFFIGISAFCFYLYIKSGPYPDASDIKVKQKE